MAEQALIPKIPPIKQSVSEASDTIAPETTQAVVPKVVEPVESESVELVDSKSVEPVVTDVVSSEVPEAALPEAPETTAAAESTVQVVEPNASTTVFQLTTYASFVLTFCLAGIAAVAVFRKAAKSSVKRFSISAKMLSLSYLVIVFNGVFGTYLYSVSLNRGDTSYPLIVPILSWVFVGPAVAIVLNSLLTREDSPNFKKIILDGFIYLVIFSFIAASQIPSLSVKEPLVFSFIGVFFFIFPIIRFSASLKISKSYHPELREIFVQVLIRSLLLLPLLLPILVFANMGALINDDLTLLLFNLVTFSFVLMTGLLMIISIDYITQGINADQLVAKKSAPPIAPPGSKPDAPTPTPTPAPAAPPNTPVSPVSPGRPPASTIKEKPEAVSKEPAKPKTSVAPSDSSDFASAPPSEEEEIPEAESSDPLKESAETLLFDIEKLDSTVINFDPSKSPDDESKADDSKSSKSAKGKKSSQKPKAPQSPNASKATNSNSRIKPPEKPKKRF